MTLRALDLDVPAAKERRRRMPLLILSHRVAALVLGAFAALAVATPASAADPVVVAAGDMVCGADTPAGTDCVHAKTSDVAVAANPQAVLTLGDNQYENGQLANFQSFYGPTWGRLKSVTRPTAGNHEYGTAGAAGYFDYFNGSGASSGVAGDRGKGYYSFNLGAWHIIALNSNCAEVACYAGSPQESWLRQDLAANTAPCTLAYWHHPRWSSDLYELDTTAVDPLMRALYTSGADLVLNGHAHDYERFLPQNPDGGADSARGLTEIVVGTGGRSEVSFSKTPNINSLVRKTGTYGVLKLGLGNGIYNYNFLPIAGQTWTDSGAGECHNAASSEQRQLTFAPSADTYADAGSPGANYGKDTTMYADASTERNAYLKFPVTGLNGAVVQSAKLRLWAKDPSKSGGTFSAVGDTTWGETTLTWNNRPAAGAAVATLGSVSKGRWYEVDVTPLVKGDGTVSIRISSSSSDGVGYATEEDGAGTAPQLIVSGAPGDTSAPSVPGNLTGSAASSTRVELGWSASQDNVAVTGYRIYRDGSPAGTSSTTSFADTTVAAGSTHSYAVTAYDAAGNESARSSTVSVTTPASTGGGTSTGTLTFTATDDTYVQEDVPNSNFGTDTTTIVDGSPRRNVFLKFNVSGIGTASVTKSVLRLKAENATVFGGSFQRVADTSWTQGSLTWNNQPSADATVLGTLGATAYNGTYDVDVTGLVTKDGLVTVRISSTNGDGGGYWSIEGGTPAKLIVTTG